MHLLANRSATGHDAYAEGALRQQAGEARAACPYPARSVEAEDWLEGWDESRNAERRPVG